MEQTFEVDVDVDAGGAAASDPRSVEHEYTVNWAPILGHLGASLLISTYQAGKVVVVGPGWSADGCDLRLQQAPIWLAPAWASG